ncbi:hypothetical protein BDK51DRAFT_16109 [Blyttiomyces helicus]|uniref:Cation-transporting P-type ATPase C-terminal domain-containing protein n=1 Tax=Blyttiomyces helicus TaxID=388810 RepID=A0A4P9WA39_9FUNG|nr:hypothetical protein BDK51DRAFT_16109 [Blyttiomyces helicus]|eukprot:RKO88395.1 hypothetical protein BDK51DRAFT_16109 [Blyttiomyces helicus]
MPLAHPVFPLWIRCTVALMNLYGPAFQNLFGTTPVPTEFWFIPLGFAIGLVATDEIRKLIIRKYPNSIVAKAAW